jgi:hypothetical protein
MGGKNLTEKIVFDKSKASYDEYGYVVIDESHNQMLLALVPRLRAVLTEKWKVKLDAWLANPTIPKGLKWRVFEKCEPDFYRMINDFIASFLHGGTLHVAFDGDGYAPSGKFDRGILSEVIKKALFALPLDSILQDACL